jgi:large subunit ribosomal protein LP2
MRYVSAYLLATLGGNKNPSKEDIKKILSSVGIEADDEKTQKVIKELNGKSIEDIIAKGFYISFGFNFVFLYFFQSIND